MDIYERVKQPKMVEVDTSETSSKKRPVKKQKMSLAMLHTMSTVHFNSINSNHNNTVPQESNAPIPLPNTSPQGSTTSRVSHVSSVSIPARIGNTLPSTSLALMLHFLPLPSILAFARCCRDWHQLVATSKLCWSGGKALARVKGSREERRRKGEADEAVSQPRNFNPNEAHKPNYNRITSATKSSNPEVDIDPRCSSTFLTHPLLYVSCQPLFRHVRHLSYTFSPPTIRTSLASLWSEDMFECDVIAAELPFAHLPSGVFLFLSSVALRDISLCTQLSIQSAFQRFGVQSHSFLRALLLHVSPVLSAGEQANTLNAMIREVGAQLSNLEIFQCSQRTLPASISFQPLLSLNRLHTLIFHSSLEKTSDRLEVIKALSLHCSLKHLEWPLWTAAQIKMLFGGVAHSMEDEVLQEETMRAMSRDAHSQQILANQMQQVAIDHSGNDGDPSTIPSAGHDDIEEVIIGLDADEDTSIASESFPTGVNALLSSLSSDHHAPSVPPVKSHFGFEEWTIDRGVSSINLLQYWCSTPTIFPQLRILSFVEPQNFASFSPLLSRMLSNLPNLTATRFHVSFYALGDFWRQMSLRPLNQLKTFELNHLYLVSSNSSSSGPVLDLDEDIQRGSFQLQMWNCLSSLRVLSLAHLVMPLIINMQDPSQTLARSCPLLEEVRLEKVAFRHAAGGRASGTSFEEFLSQLRQLRILRRLELLHLQSTTCDSEDLFQSASATLHQLLTCDAMESFVYCNQSHEPAANAASHRLSHEQWGAHIDRRWKCSSVYFFEDEEEAAAGASIANPNPNSATSSAASSTSSSSSQRVKKTMSSGSVNLSREHQQLLHVQTLFHQRRRDLKRQQRSPGIVEKACNVVGINIHYWNEEHSCAQFLPAIKL